MIRRAWSCGGRCARSFSKVQPLRVPTRTKRGNAGDEIHNRDSWFPTVVDGAVGCGFEVIHLPRRIIRFVRFARFFYRFTGAAVGSHAMDTRLQVGAKC